MVCSKHLFFFSLISLITARPDGAMYESWQAPHAHTAMHASPVKPCLSPDTSLTALSATSVASMCRPLS